MNKSESIAALAKALAGFQSEVKQPLKDKSNPFFKSKYVPLENVVEAITQTSGKYGLSFIQFPINNGDTVGVTTMIMHESGEFIECEPVFAKPAKNDPQAVGSVITYLKRYSLSAVFGITADEDDDGNSSSTVTQGGQAQQSYNKPKQQTSGRQAVPKNVQEAANMIVPFGEKHKGKRLADVFKEDQQYIQWLFTSDKTDEAFRTGCELLIAADAEYKAKKAQQG